MNGNGARPENITINTCDITGSVRVWGMAKNGEGEDFNKSSRRERKKQQRTSM